MQNRYLYEVVYEDIKNKIIENKMVYGSALPSNKELMQEYKVSAITITKALNELKQEGYINRIKGTGTFVSLTAETKEEIVEDILEEKFESKEEKEKIIGLIFEHISSCFGLDMFYEIDRIAADVGYRVCLRFSYGDRQKESDEIKFLKEIGVCAMVLMPCHEVYYNTEILKLVVEEFPVVLVDKIMQGVSISSVRNDDYYAMKKLVDNLYKKGCRNIGYLTSKDEGTSSIHFRKRGFEKAMKNKGLKLHNACILTDIEKSMRHETRNDIEKIWVESIRKYFEENSGLDAVICAEYTFVRYLKFAISPKRLTALNVRCIDSDDIAANGFTYTHVKQDEKVIAQKAMEIIFKQLHEPDSYEQIDCVIKGIFREKQ